MIFKNFLIIKTSLNDEIIVLKSLKVSRKNWKFLGKSNWPKFQVKIHKMLRFSYIIWQIKVYIFTVKIKSIEAKLSSGG